MTQVTRAHWAHAYCNEQLIAVTTCSGYRSGTVFDFKQNKYVLPADCSDQGLGKAVQRALAHSRFLLSAPRAGSIYPPDLAFDAEVCHFRNAAEHFQNWIDELIQEYGYTNKRSFFKGMKSCGLTQREGRIEITPSHHEQREAWTGKGITEDDVVVISADSEAAQVGAALRLAFTRCTE